MASTPSWLASYSNVTRRRFIKGAAAGAGGAFLLACGGGSDTGGGGSLAAGDVRKPGAVIYAKDSYKIADQTKEAVAGGVLTESVNDDFTENFDVFLSITPAADNFTGIVYEYMLAETRGPGIAPGSREYLTMSGATAESWEISPDGLTYTFKQRPNVKFHNIPPVNGRVMNIDDWRTSMQRMQTVGANSPAFNEVVDTVTYPDSQRMTLKLKEPYAPLLIRLGTDINFSLKTAPKELNDKPDLGHTQMIGTNYRMLDKYQPSVARTWKANPDFWGGKPLIERWNQPIIPEYANRYAQFLAQSIESFTPTPQDALKLRSDAPQAIMVGQEIEIATANRMIFGKREKDTVPWKDARARIALHRNVDWEAITRFQSNQEQYKAAGVDIELHYTSHVSQDPSFFLDPRKGELGKESENYLYNPAEAKKLLEAAGLPNGYDIDMYFNAGQTTTPRQQDVDQWNLYLDNYKRNGQIRVNPVYLTRQEYFDRITYAADIKGVQMSQSSSSNDIDYLLFRNYSSRYHLAAYTDPQVDKAIDDQRRATDPIKRAEFIKEFQKLMASRFYALPGNGRWGTFAFEWDWIRNKQYLGPNGLNGHKIWLDPNMPRRNG
jgi:ABC-type transport system substrate-binding protein